MDLTNKISQLQKLTISQRQRIAVAKSEIKQKKVISETIANKEISKLLYK